MAALQHKLQADVAQLQTIQRDLAKAVASRQKLESQCRECDLVLSELKILDDADAIYKAFGSVLLVQDKTEALANVEKRLEYIAGEIARVEAQLKELGEKEDKKREEVMKMQQFLQEKMQQAQAKA